MNVYFSYSIRGAQSTSVPILEIENFLHRIGDIVSEHRPGEHFSKGKLGDAEIFERDIRCLLSADIVVAEISNPSLGVGFEIGIAEEKGIPVLALALSSIPEGNISGIIKGSENVKYVRYSRLTLESDLKRILGEICESTCSFT